jgi:hypothetical protein
LTGFRYKLIAYRARDGTKMVPRRLWPHTIMLTAANDVCLLCALVSGHFPITTTTYAWLTFGGLLHGSRTTRALCPLISRISHSASQSSRCRGGCDFQTQHVQPLPAEKTLPHVTWELISGASLSSHIPQSQAMKNSSCSTRSTLALLTFMPSFLLYL